MPRATLGKDKPAGNSPLVQFKLSALEKAEMDAAVGKGESLSEMIRLAISREIQRRKRKK